MTKYPTRVDTFDLRQWGTLRFRQWLFNDIPIHFCAETVDIVARHVETGSFAVDIGAYTGDTAIPMALAAGPSGKVLAFEPGPASYPFLIENLYQLNDLFHVDTVPFAVTDRDQLFTFHYDDYGFINGGYSTNLEAGLAGTGNRAPHKVKGVSLSKFLTTYHEEWLDKWSYLKIDTEGYDKDILFANAAILGKYKPTIEIEVYPFLTEKEREELKSAIKYIGYKWDAPDNMFYLTPPLVANIICHPN